MATENTPLTKDDLGNVRKQLIEVGSQVKNKALDFSQAAGNRYIPLRILAILGGFGVCATSATSLLWNIITLNLSSFILEFYCTLLGGLIIVMEVTKMVKVEKYFKYFNEFLHKYIRILGFISGRGIFYFIVGTLKLTKMDLLSLVTGPFMCFVGILYYIIGMSIARKFKKIEGGFLARVNLKLQFSKSDTNGTGFLNVVEFKNLLENLGIELDNREVDLAFTQLDKNCDGVITYEEFESFCEEFKFETEHNETMEV